MKTIKTTNYEKIAQELPSVSPPNPVDQVYDNMNEDFESLLQNHAQQIASGEIDYQQALVSLQKKVVKLLTDAVNEVRPHLV